jgi:hypothetical protein
MGLGTEVPDQAAAQRPVERALGLAEVAGVGLRRAAFGLGATGLGLAVGFETLEQALDRARGALQLGGGGS